MQNIHTGYLGCFILFLLFTPLTSAARNNGDSSLYQTITHYDSLLFESGFNNCDIEQFERLLSQDFEFYHDKAGITGSKGEFIESIRKNICGLEYKPLRVLDSGSMTIYPLRSDGVIYGTVQSGVHRFYAREPGKAPYLTSVAKFTHFWRFEGEEWRLSRSFSYDHQDEETSESPDFEDASSVKAWLKKNNVPALGIGVIKEGQLQEVEIYGELVKGRAASINSLFNVASITKTFVAMLTLKLVSSGMWDLDEPLARYWTDPDVAEDPRSKRLTTRDILSHRSGFPNWRRELVGSKLAFQFEPGSAYRYSGEGYEYLRRALENKFKRSLDVLANEHLLHPLGLRDTRFMWDTATDTLRVATPHDANGNVLPIYKNTSANAADLMMTTLADLGRLMIAVMNGEGLSKDVASEMTRHYISNKQDCYLGLGCFMYDNLGNGEYAISHGGDDPGMHSIFFLLPKSRRGLIVFTNSDNGPKLYSDILRYYLKEQGQAIVDIEMRE